MTDQAASVLARLKNRAKASSISYQQCLQLFFQEEFLRRLAASPYKNNFILKGGFLISAIVGLETRTTMDLDTTIKGFTLTHESIREIFSEICDLKLDDDVSFDLISISDIREGDDYPGIRLALKANYLPISVPLTVDVTTGDIITPREIKYTIPMMFDKRSINILAYNIETILAEKIETVLSRSIANTRPRDFYDIHILSALRGAECNPSTLRQALEGTAAKRGSQKALDNYADIVTEIRNSTQLQDFWKRYQRDSDYAKGISFNDTCDSILRIMGKVIGTSI